MNWGFQFGCLSTRAQKTMRRQGGEPQSGCAFLPTNSCKLKLATRRVPLVGQPESRFWQANGKSAYEACNSARAAKLQAVCHRCSSQPNENEHNSQEPSHLRPTDYWRDIALHSRSRVNKSVEDASAGRSRSAGGTPASRTCFAPGFSPGTCIYAREHHAGANLHRQKWKIFDQSGDFFSLFRARQRAIKAENTGCADLDIK